MVSLQAEQIERIDANMDETLHHVDQGHSQLVKVRRRAEFPRVCAPAPCLTLVFFWRVQYYHTMTGNRALMAKIFLVLMISMVFFIIFGT